MNKHLLTKQGCFFNSFLQATIPLICSAGDFGVSLQRRMEKMPAAPSATHDLRYGREKGVRNKKQSLYAGENNHCFVGARRSLIK